VGGGGPPRPSHFPHTFHFVTTTRVWLLADKRLFQCTPVHLRLTHLGWAATMASSWDTIEDEPPRERSQKGSGTGARTSFAAREPSFVMKAAVNYATSGSVTDALVGWGTLCSTAHCSIFLRLLNCSCAAKVVSKIHQRFVCVFLIVNQCISLLRQNLRGGSHRGNQ
jgi:hypothetical protein